MRLKSRGPNFVLVTRERGIFHVHQSGLACRSENMLLASKNKGLPWILCILTLTLMIMAMLLPSSVDAEARRNSKRWRRKLENREEDNNPKGGQLRRNHRRGRSKVTSTYSMTYLILLELAYATLLNHMMAVTAQFDPVFARVYIAV